MEKYCPRCFKKYAETETNCSDDGAVLLLSAEKDLVGEVIDGRYKVLECVGHGGMGVVYKAEQLMIGRVVALKVLRRELAGEERAVKRFMNEVRAVASLNNRHTVTLYDFGVTPDGLLYFTMELLSGRPLSSIIAVDGPMELTRAAAIVMQVCQSLREAHEKGIFHRDLKPDNLFIQQQDGNEEVKVLDFGIAKLLGDMHAGSVTKTGMIVGTPQYLSPEQALGNPVGPASDIYSLTAVFYEMICGSPPFPGDDEAPMKTMLAHIREPVPALTTRNPCICVPPAVEAIIQKGLQKDATRRFQSVAELIHVLRGAIREYSANATHMTAPLPAVFEAGASRVTHVPMQTPNSMQGPRYSVTEPILDSRLIAAAQPPDRRKFLPWVLLGAVLLILAGVGVGKFMEKPAPPSETAQGAAPSLAAVARPTEPVPVPSCKPECAGRVCGDDGCGGTCGACGGSARCVEGACECVPSCKGKTCGDDGCGGTCGDCSRGQHCVEGDCVCEPSCKGRNCGPDGCGGSCGSCGADQSCGPELGLCIHNDMVYVPAGAFLMGSTMYETGRTSAEVQHEVTLSYHIELSRFETTQREFHELMGYNPSHFTACGPDCPVDTVSWYEALAFANAKSAKEGLPECFDCTGAAPAFVCRLKSTFELPQDCTGYRLPTEAEWEFAYRSSTDTPFYNGALAHTACDPVDPNLDAIGWYCGNAGNQTHPVGKKQANTWGLYDMSGNVWEWVWDKFGNYPMKVVDPVGASAKSPARVFRGGSWYDFAEFCRAAKRDSYIPANRLRNVGFRLARSLF